MYTYMYVVRDLTHVRNTHACTDDVHMFVLTSAASICKRVVLNSVIGGSVSLEKNNVIFLSDVICCRILHQAECVCIGR